MAAGDDVTVPLPTRVVVSVHRTSVNVAVTLLLLSIVSVQVPVPVHAPDQPANVEPASGVAVSVTMEPST